METAVEGRLEDISKTASEESSYKDVNIEEYFARTRPSRSLEVLARKRPVFEAPEFVRRLNAFEETEEGSTVVFECQYHALPKPTLRWFKDDEEITQDEAYEIEHTDRGEVRLILEHVTKLDEGTYKCKVENVEGVASTTGYLSVKDNQCDKTLSSQQPKKQNGDRSVSNAPHLRTIIEQKSVEEREAEAQSDMPRSPIQDFIDNIDQFRKSRTWPMMSADRAREEDEYSSSSDTSVDSQDYDRVDFEVADETEASSDFLSSRYRTRYKTTSNETDDVSYRRRSVNGRASPPGVEEVMRDLLTLVGGLTEGLDSVKLFCISLVSLATFVALVTEFPPSLFATIVGLVFLVISPCLIELPVRELEDNRVLPGDENSHGDIVVPENT